jgi:hypothetical protein
MTTTLDPLHIRRILGRETWRAPSPFGPDGWRYDHRLHGSVIVTNAAHGEHDWVHASIAWPDRMPSYDDLKLLHRAVFGDGWAYQVFAPPADHVNIHSFALHLFGRLDGAPVLPDFTEGTGSI